MPAWFDSFADFAVIGLLIVGISLFRKPKHARSGNILAALALLTAMGLVVYRFPISSGAIVASTIVIGGIIGTLVAFRVNMIQIPALVAFQHGMGGVAAFSVSFLELLRNPAELSLLGHVSGLLGLVLGAATFSGSMIASGKLSARLKQTPVNLPGHNLLLLALIAGAIVLGVSFGSVGGHWVHIGMLAAILALAGLMGIIFSIRIGGADMPVLISFLNATAGLAAAFCGIIISNRLLIACGATVAASGSILTAIMCRSMNRGLIKVFTGSVAKASSAGAQKSDEMDVRKERRALNSREEMKTEAVHVLREAERVIVVPGYGMALAQAQFQVAKLARILEEEKKNVCFAIHPVAGRMPGHMNVLLAEAEVDYEKLLEMADVNGRFDETDAVLVVGACDVVNPAAITTEGTPISGMPILQAHKARRVIVCNLDEKPGYSGVDNPLYSSPKTMLLLGDAKSTITDLIEGIAGPQMAV